MCSVVGGRLSEIYVLGKHYWLRLSFRKECMDLLLLRSISNCPKERMDGRILLLSSVSRIAVCTYQIKSLEHVAVIFWLWKRVFVPLPLKKDKVSLAALTTAGWLYKAHRLVAYSVFADRVNGRNANNYFHFCNGLVMTILLEQVIIITKWQ